MSEYCFRVAYTSLALDVATFGKVKSTLSALKSILIFFQIFGLMYKIHFDLKILLLVGTKLELVIMEMAQQIQDRTVIVRGAPVVQPSNQFFWFNRPRWILFLIHFTLFQVYIQISFYYHKCS